MTEAQILVAAAAVAAAAALARPVPTWVLAAMTVVALLRRRALVVVVLLVVVVSTEAARAEAGVGIVGQGATVDGVADVLTDPQPRPGGASLELRLGGRRYWAFIAHARPSERAGRTRTGSVEQLRAGERIRVQGRTQPLRAPWHWMAARHLAGRLVVSSALPVDAGPWWWRSANEVHRLVEAGLDGFDPDDRALFLGLVLGDDRDQSEVQRYRFRTSGLSHLMAVSGQNVGFALVAASPLLRRCSLRVRWLLTGVLLGWFALVTRLEPSVLRAVAMAMVAATATWWGRYVTGRRVVAVAVIGVVTVDPLLVWSLGFRLSVVACLAIVVVAPPLQRRLIGPRAVREAVAVALVAQVATAPLLLPLSGSVPVAGPLFNLAAVPVAGWVMVWGVTAGPLAGAIARFAPGPLALVAAPLAVPSRWLTRWVGGVAAVGAQGWWPRSGPPGVVAAALLVGLGASWDWLAERTGPGRRWWRAMAWLAVAVVAADALASTDRLRGSPLGSALTPAGVEIGGDARSGRCFSDGRNTVVVIDGRVSEPAVMAMLARGRVRRADVVVALGGGSVAAQAVWTLRNTVGVGVVLAADPSAIRDALQLVEGTVKAGRVAVAIDRGGDRRWRARAAPRAGGESERAPHGQ